MQKEGADIIDVGGESTRPGAQSVTLQEELDRVLSIIEAIAKELSIPVSIDTSKPDVMREAVNAGAGMVNDVYALRQPGALETVAKLDVSVCLMHMQGKPRTMQESPDYPGGVVNEVKSFLADRVKAAIDAGISKDNIFIDPGFGFGKTLEHNYELLSDLQSLSEIGCRIMVGLSRKSMIGKLLNTDIDERLAGSIAAATVAVINGADMVRAHDVKETVQALQVVSACRFLPGVSE